MSKPAFRCSVQTQFLPEQSELPDGPFGFAYTVTIENIGDVSAQLVARRWLITDGTGMTQEVRGLAVVGKQPLLGPGEKFEYTSWTQIGSSQGSMQGTYYCMTEHAEPFEADVPEFVLARPEALH